MILLTFAISSCALHKDTPLERASPITISAQDPCANPPRASRGKFRHAKNRLLQTFGAPRHRGVDLIAVETDNNQTVGGKLAYTAADSDITGEDVELFACVEHHWADLGTTPTDHGGRFEITLRGPDRLPPGLHDLYAQVPGDGTGFRFLAYVARTDERVIVTDLDGTITSGEGAVFNTVLFGDDIGHRIGAPQALTSSGHTVVYVSSRGDQLTGMTRAWLRNHGFPPGPLRLSRALATKPGPKTVTYKTAVLRGLPMPVHAAIGNRASDVEAYSRAGVPADRIFVKVPGFEQELADAIATHHAIPFTSYDALSSRLR